MQYAWFWNVEQDCEICEQHQNHNIMVYFSYLDHNPLIDFESKLFEMYMFLSSIANSLISYLRIDSHQWYSSNQDHNLQDQHLNRPEKKRTQC